MEKDDRSDIQSVYSEALDGLIAKVREDSTIVAAVLLGSMAYDAVWERSDIDLLLVTEEVRLSTEGVCLVEMGVNIHAFMATRSRFRKLLEGAAQGSFIHSMLGKGTLLFSRDEPLAELFENRHLMGERDRATQLLRVSLGLLPALTKAQKWFHAKRDYDYCFHWLMKCVDSLASIELLLNGEVPTREVIHRALALNASLFRGLYTDLIHGDPSPADLEAALASIDRYLHANRDSLFGLVLEHLAEVADVRSITEINHHFQRNYSVEGVDNACEWLADEGVIQKLAVPVRLTPKSRVSMEEAAYYYEGSSPAP